MMSRSHQYYTILIARSSFGNRLSSTDTEVHIFLPVCIIFSPPLPNRILYVSIIFLFVWICVSLYLYFAEQDVFRGGQHLTRPLFTGYQMQRASILLKTGEDIHKPVQASSSSSSLSLLLDCWHWNRSILPILSKLSKDIAKPVKTLCIIIIIIVGIWHCHLYP